MASRGMTRICTVTVITNIAYVDVGSIALIIIESASAPLQDPGPSGT